jgi:hypothetical protein
VVAHNAKAIVDDQFIRIRLPSNSHKAEIWSEGGFKDVAFDILEDIHFKAGGNESMQY